MLHTILLKYIPSLGFLFIWWRELTNTSPKSLIGVHLGWAVNAIAHNLHIRKDMFHHRLKVVNQQKFAMNILCKHASKFQNTTNSFFHPLLYIHSILLLLNLPASTLLKELWLIWIIQRLTVSYVGKSDKKLYTRDYKIIELPHRWKQRFTDI